MSIETKVKKIQEKLKLYREEMQKQANAAKAATEAAHVFNGAVQALEDCLKVLNAPEGESNAVLSPSGSLSEGAPNSSV